jgi:hypothetical protein
MFPGSPQPCWLWRDGVEGGTPIVANTLQGTRPPTGRFDCPGAQAGRAEQIVLRKVALEGIDRISEK